MKTIAAIAALASAITVASRDVPFVIVNNGEVRTFYGVPVMLRIEHIASLGLPYRIGEEPGGEGMVLRKATLQGRDNVRVTAVFSGRGDCLELKTTSPRAVDPRGIRVGDALPQVRKIWPEGKLYHGRRADAPSERYALYATGTNVILRLNSNVQDPGAAPTRVRVKEIVIKPFRVPA
jgi:hypothetical protein